MQEKKLNWFEGILVFLCILFKYLIVYGVSQTILYMYMMIVAVIIMIDIINKKFSRNEFLKIMFFLGISAYFVVIYQDVNFLISFLLAMLCIRRNDNSFVKMFFISSVFMYILTIILNNFGVLESHNIYRMSENELILRNSLGFSHPNEVFLFFIPIALAGYYLYSDKIIYYIILIVTSSILYQISDSRTGFIVIICIIIFQLFSKKVVRFKLNKILPYVILILTILSIWLAKTYGNDLENNISDMFSGRPYYWNYYLENGKMFTILGKNQIEDVYLDNFYLYMLVELGIVGYMIYYMIYYNGFKKIYMNNKMVVIIITFLIYGISETNVIIGSINFLFAIILKELIVENKIEEEKNEQTNVDINYSTDI